MKVIVGASKYSLKNTHPYAQAILALARAYTADGATPNGVKTVPERNDIKQLWRELSSAHQQFLTHVASHPDGVPQADLERHLGVDWQGLRGTHNGLARICERLGTEKPVRAVGYNATNRRYVMDPDAAATVRGLSQPA